MTDQELYLQEERELYSAACSVDDGTINLTSYQCLKIEIQARRAMRAMKQMDLRP